MVPRYAPLHRGGSQVIPVQRNQYNWSTNYVQSLYQALLQGTDDVNGRTVLWDVAGLDMTIRVNWSP